MTKAREKPVIPAHGGKRASAYVRVSRAYAEDDDRVTIDAQLADIEDYCRGHGYELVGRYVDKDKYKVKGHLVNPSGTRKDRPAYTAMIKAARAGDFDVIVGWKEDRLYRGVYAAVPLAEALDDLKGALRVELVKETFDRSMLEIKAAIAKKEIENIRQRMVMGRRVRLQRGEVPGGLPRYGYDKREKRLMVNEAEAAIVRRIFEWYNDEENNMEIRARLIAMTVPARKGTAWSKVSIEHVLTFAGYATGEYTTTLDGEVFTIPCPKIISMETWRRAQEQRKHNITYRGRNVKEDYLCRGMVVCACGWKMHAITCRGPGQTGKCGYFACSKKQNQPEFRHPDCPDTIGSKTLDNFVWNFVLKLCQDPTVIQDAIDDRLRELQAEQGDLEAEMERAQRALDKMTEERQWVITQARQKRITEEDMDHQLVALDMQALMLRKEHEDKAAALAIKKDAEGLKAWAAEYLTDLGRGLDVLTVDPATMEPGDFEAMYETLAASRFEVKFEGDRLRALGWAMLEERRHTVRTLISEVLVVAGKNPGKRSKREKLIIPKLRLRVPARFMNLVYDHQSPDYRVTIDDEESPTLHLSVDAGRK